MSQELDKESQDFQAVSPLLEYCKSRGLAPIGSTDCGPTFSDLLAASGSPGLVVSDEYCMDWSKSDHRRGLDYLIQRFYYVEVWSWGARPHMELWPVLINFLRIGPILEINAGKGLWAELYRRYKVEHQQENLPDWTATDIDPKKPIGTVEVLDSVAAVAKYPKATTLVTVWPKMGFREALSTFTGPQLVYVGEEDGCTDTFDTSNWTLVTKLSHPRWFAMHDFIFCYRRKE